MRRGLAPRRGRHALGRTVAPPSAQPNLLPVARHLKVAAPHLFAAFQQPRRGARLTINLDLRADAAKPASTT
ncbi:MAG: hypothetical protein A3F78_09530 [Burkholderiales bacterium RIFCSPLOWO2_12_FULL_61_40]|nr:MAG: hypothetical protein A3F78_09530 [Burkholderiales bacterium RIFCSPLOWO2_12_FULL_61_40]